VPEHSYPAVHAVQLPPVAPPRENRPDVHAVGAALVDGHRNPGGQVVHITELANAYVPLGQLIVAIEFAGAALPAEVAVHAVTPASPVCPLLHTVGTTAVDAPPVPRGMDMQVDQPASENVPAAQAASDAAPPAHEFPALHCVHAVRGAAAVAWVPADGVGGGGGEVWYGATTPPPSSADGRRRMLTWRTGDSPHLGAGAVKPGGAICACRAARVVGQTRRAGGAHLRPCRRDVAVAARLRRRVGIGACRPSGALGTRAGRRGDGIEASRARGAQGGPRAGGCPSWTSDWVVGGVGARVTRRAGRAGCGAKPRRVRAGSARGAGHHTTRSGCARRARHGRDGTRGVGGACNARRARVELVEPGGTRCRGRRRRGRRCGRGGLGRRQGGQHGGRQRPPRRGGEGHTVHDDAKVMGSKVNESGGRAAAAQR